jgi:hypothetical protein
MALFFLGHCSFKDRKPAGNKQGQFHYPAKTEPDTQISPWKVASKATENQARQPGREAKTKQVIYNSSK